MRKILPAVLLLLGGCALLPYLPHAKRLVAENGEPVLTEVGEFIDTRTFRQFLQTEAGTGLVTEANQRIEVTFP